MKKNLFFHSLLLTGVLFHAGCMKKTSTYETQTNINHATYEYDHREATTIAPLETTGAQYQLQSIQGESILIAERQTGFLFPQYQGKVVLLQIFGKECSYCFEEMPIINTVRNKYGANLQVIAIQAQDRMMPSTASRIINQYQMNYPIIEADEATRLLLFLNQTYGWRGGLPFMQLIKNGVTEYTFPESPSHQELEESINNLL